MANNCFLVVFDIVRIAQEHTGHQISVVNNYGPPVITYPAGGVSAGSPQDVLTHFTAFGRSTEATVTGVMKKQGAADTAGTTLMEPGNNNEFWWIDFTVAADASNNYRLEVTDNIPQMTPADHIRAIQGP